MRPSMKMMRESNMNKQLNYRNLYDRIKKRNDNIKRKKKKGKEKRGMKGAFSGTEKVQFKEEEYFDEISPGIE